jgi:hypothetical protein
MQATRTNRHQAGRSLVVLVLCSAFALMSCGSSPHNTARVASSTSVTSPRPSGSAVVQIGDAAISPAAYAHWMAIGAATVEMPKPTGPLPTVTEYTPPAFTACVARRRALVASANRIPALRSECRKIYEGIQARVLNFLVTGYWLRGEAAEMHASVSQAEVHRKFKEYRQEDFPTPAAFQRLEEASHQSVRDLEFAVETRMLSTRLLERFTRRVGNGKTEQATITAFNRYIASRWLPRTSCKPGYVVKDCKQYRTK